MNSGGDDDDDDDDDNNDDIFKCIFLKYFFLYIVANFTGLCLVSDSQ